MLFCSSLKMLQKVSNILKAPFGGRGVTLTSSSSATCELLQHSRTSKFSRCGCSIGRNELLLGSLKGRCPFSVPLLWAAPGTQSKRLPSCPVVSWKRNGSTLKWWCKLAVLCWLCWQCRKNRSWRLFHPLRYDMLWCFPSSILSLEKKTSTSLCSSLLFCWACLRKSTCRAGPRVLMHPCTNSVSPIRWSPSCPTGRFPKDTNERTKAKNSQEIPCLVLLYICNCWPGHEKWWCLLGFFPRPCPSSWRVSKRLQL